MFYKACISVFVRLSVCVFFFCLLPTSCRDYQLHLHEKFTRAVSMNTEKLIKLNFESHPHLHPDLGFLMDF